MGSVTIMFWMVFILAGGIVWLRKKYGEILLVKFGLLDADEYLAKECLKMVNAELILLNLREKERIYDKDESIKEHRQNKLGYFRTMQQKAIEGASKKGDGEVYWNMVFNIAMKAIEKLNANEINVDKLSGIGDTSASIHSNINGYEEYGIQEHGSNGKINESPLRFSSNLRKKCSIEPIYGDNASSKKISNHSRPT